MIRSNPGAGSRWIAALATAALATLLGACTVNPVTGEQELGLVSPAQERAIGEQQYGPSQQSQGGPYVIDPALSDYVSRVGQRLAAVSDRPELPYEFVVLNSTVPNAWALPGGKIAINLGLLLELDNEAELAAVLSHEIVHAAARHGAQRMEQGMLLGAGMQVLGATLQNQPYRDVILQGAGLGSALIQSRYSRDAELEADAYGMRYMAAAGYDPMGAVTLQETFVRLAEGRRQDWLSGLFASHPPSQARVDANRRLATELGRGGTLGEDSYRRATAALRRAAPAYEAYDEAQQALAAEDYDRALRLADRAIDGQPEQSLFHELRAVALLSRDDERAALRALNQALNYNPRFYRHHLLRGMLHKRLGDNAEAERDLRTANELLPTAQATYALGELALARGDRRTAAGHFQQVANSNSPLAPAAREQLQRMQWSQ